MKSVVIYYFSGTGNTKMVSEMVKAHFEASNIGITLISIEKQLKSTIPIDMSKYDMLGLAYPIYGLGTPAIVDSFIKKLPPGKGLKVFIFLTGADYISLNHNASTKLIKELEKLNYSVFYNRIIVMPSNWLIKYSDSLVKQLVLCAQKKVENMCNEILNLKRRRYNTGGIIKYISLSIAFLEKRYGSKQFGMSLRIKNSCNHCGICVSNCPTDNIIEEGNSFIFLNKCIFCMRCIYRCPKNSIESKGFGFSILKDGYNIDKVLQDVTISSNYINKKTKGYFKHFYKYLYDVEL